MSEHVWFNLTIYQNYFLGTPYTLTEDRPAAVFQLLIEPDFFVR